MREVIGVGIDICQVARFEAMVARRPGILDRLLTPGEQLLADGRLRRVESLAARFAAKEALAKALGSPGGLRFTDAQVITDAAGRPGFELHGSVQTTAAELGVQQVLLSLSHDAGLAIAMVLVQGRADA